MDVRAADADEVEALAALWHQGWHEAHAAIVPDDLARMRTLTSFRDRLQAALTDIRVAGPRGTPLGFCFVRGDELYQLYIAAPARGVGIAAALLADAEARLAAAGFDTAWLACAIGNDRAARFYEKHGWRRARTATIELETDIGPYALDIWRYEKALSESPPLD